MAKAIEFVIDLSRKQARIFLEDILHPKKDAGRDALIEKAKRLNIELR
ncbi:MAG: hypothetical protein V1822_00285 [Candidatus Micrarchaeota archaeon]